MPAIAWSEIRSRAATFARDWAGETSERAEAQSFWNEFFAVFGVDRRRTGVRFEKAAQRFGKRAKGRIDVFWPGLLLAEHKSAGQSLDAAHTQATDYFEGLNDDELPRYIVVSDFQNFRIFDLEDGTEAELTLAELPKKTHLFGFIAGFQKVRIREEPEANIKAVQKLGELHDALKTDGYKGHALEVFLVRILFCLFADDTGLFSPKDSFLELLETTDEDGSDTGRLLAGLFQCLNQRRDARQRSLAETFAPFPYVNGKLFEERPDIPAFDSNMRALLLECCRLNWSSISPAIFGAMFQKIIELDAKDRRRQLGAHYTSEANILKVIRPLFLDELRAEFERIKHNKNALFEFHKKLPTLNFLDPACGCGNFLVITYRELRRLEADVLRAAEAFGAHIVGAFKQAVMVNVDQFYGIEIEEFPAQVAQVAMWLTDHQMNVEVGLAFGEPFDRLPLEKSANIRQGNALRLDWEAFVPPTKLNYILGNPPFVGKQLQSEDQKKDLAIATNNLKGIGVLDFVCGWYFKAAQYLSGSKEGFASGDKKQFADVRFGKQPPGIEDIFVSLDQQDSTAREHIRCAFVSTNSITQGEQVGVLWSQLLRHGIKIQFAHRTFKWTNEAPGKAAVHCVIIGFGREDLAIKPLFDYAEIDGPAIESKAGNINPYLVDAPDVVLPSRGDPLCQVPPMLYGSKPVDGGFLLLDNADKQRLVSVEPNAAKWIRPFVSAHEYLNGETRWCLWLTNISSAQLAALSEVRKRVEGVRDFRAASKKVQTVELAKTPTLFAEIRQPKSDYLLVPAHSSENRSFIPFGYMAPDVINGNSNLAVPDAPMWLFGAMTSTMHMA
jgi:hypothetical protein